MNLDAVISEPFARLLTLHNAFNRSIKVNFGALALLSNGSTGKGTSEAVALPTGSEPWGRETRWRNPAEPLRDAAIFLAELGIARAAAAFEDYADGAKGEFDRAALTQEGAKRYGTSALHGFDAIVGVDVAALSDLTRLAEFFDTARNCVVHRSNRASAYLASLRADPALDETLRRWPKRMGKWTVSLPAVGEGHVVEWRPRHAILASDVYYRAARVLDRRLVARMGPTALTRMAVHWAFFADPTAPCASKHSPEIIVRAQLTGRYKAKGLTIADTIDLLRKGGQWDAVRAAWNERFPDGPETALARLRRARKGKKP